MLNMSQNSWETIIDIGLGLGQFGSYVGLIWRVHEFDEKHVKDCLISLLVFHTSTHFKKNMYRKGFFNGILLNFRGFILDFILFLPLFGVALWNLLEIQAYSTFHGDTVYAAYTYIFVYNVVKIYGAYVMRSKNTKQEHIYRVRSTILTFVVSICICIIMYYTSVLSDFVSNKNNITWYSTTQFVNQSSCTPVLKEEALYATYDFTSDCAYYIWVRSRATLLATVQILIAFELVVRIPHYNNIFETERKHPLWFSAIITLISQLLLFGGMTIWVNDIDRWYIMPLSTACMLTIHAVGMSIVMIIRTENSRFPKSVQNRLGLTEPGQPSEQSNVTNLSSGTRSDITSYWRPPSGMRRR